MSLQEVRQGQAQSLKPKEPEKTTADTRPGGYVPLDKKKTTPYDKTYIHETQTATVEQPQQTPGQTGGFIPVASGLKREEITPHEKYERAVTEVRQTPKGQTVSSAKPIVISRVEQPPQKQERPWWDFLSGMRTQEVFYVPGWGQEQSQEYGEARQRYAEQHPERIWVSERDIAAGLLQVPQMVYFGAGVRALTLSVKGFPVVSKIVHGGVQLSGVLFGASAVKQIAEEPSDMRRIFDIFMFGGMIGAGAIGGGVRLSDFKGKIRSFQDMMKEPLEQPPQGFKPIDMSDLVRGYRPTTQQMTLEGFRGTRFRWTPEETLVFERTKQPGKTYTINDIIEREISQKTKPFSTDTTRQIKLFQEEPPVKSTPWDYKFKAPENKVMPVEDILTKISRESRERFIRTGIEEQRIPKQTTETTIEDAIRGRGQKLWVDEKGNIKIAELERLSNKELGKTYTIKDVTGKRLYDLTKSTEEIKTGDRTIKLLETKTKTSTIKKIEELPVESVDIGYTQGSPKLLNYLLGLEGGIELRSSHWDTIAPGQPQTQFNKPGVGSILIQPSGEISIQDMTPINAEKTVFNQIDIPMQREIQDDNQRQQEQQRQQQIPRSIPMQRQDTGQSQRQRTRLDQASEVILDMDRVLRGRIEEANEDFIGKPRFPIPSDEEEELSFTGGGQAYDVDVRRRGKFHTVGHQLSEQAGMQKGMHETENTAAATFRLRPVPGKPKNPFETQTGGFEKLTQYYRNHEGYYVEKPTYRINSPGEVREISLKGGKRARF